MKLSLAMLLLGLCLCGCSRKHAPAARSPLDRVQAGRDISFGHYVLHVDKRQGASVQGVRVLSRERDGKTATITASKGCLSPGPDKHCLTLVLNDVYVQKSKQRASVAQLTLTLPVMGL